MLDTGDCLRLDLLGPVRARRDGLELAVGPPKQRAVLGLLASRVGQVVGFDEIIDAVWGSEVPRSAPNGVHTYISRLRRALEPGCGRRDPGQVLTSVGGGYALMMDREDIDVEVFVRRHALGRRLNADGDSAGAIEAFDQAFQMWRGEAYANVPGPFAVVERARLQELRLTALEEWAGVMLAVGRKAEVVAVLSDAVARDPLREQLRWLLMLALYRCGRQAHALGIFRETRQLFSQELGIEPGLDLRQLNSDILIGHPDLGGHSGLGRPVHVLPSATGAARGSPREAQRESLREAPRPAQLPPSARGFVGRAAELARLLHALDPAQSRQRPATACAVIDGPAGVGKTTLVLELAHELAGRYPDGQLFVDLCGSDLNQPPLTASETLHHLLISLGTDPAQIPAGLAGRVALYRSVVCGQRLLVVLDDAVDTVQVRPLIPRGPACVLVTSRRRQSGLVALNGAYRVDLPPLAPAESLSLLAYLVGHERLAPQWEDAARLAELCGHLPLALRIAAESLVADPDRKLAELVRQYGDTAASLRTAFAAWYKSLPAEAARMFRLLGLYQGSTITVPVAAALANSSSPHAQRQLDVLVNMHLLEEVGQREYRRPPLVDIYASECARRLPVAGRSAALGRLLGTGRVPGVSSIEGSLAGAGRNRRRRGEMSNLLRAPPSRR
jgi:DNA-binding SARP family transcriptional activator